MESLTATHQPPPGASGRARPAARGYLEWSKIALQAFTLNAIWLIGCLPVITAPASTTALLAAVRRWRADDEPPTARQFVRDLGHCLWRDLLIGAVLAAVAAFFIADLSIIGQMGDGRRLMITLWIGCLVLVAMSSSMVFLTAAAELRFEGRRRSVKQTWLGSARLAVTHPGRVASAVAVIIGLAVAVSFSPICLLAVGVGGAALVDVIIYRRADHDGMPRHD